MGACRTIELLNMKTSQIACHGEIRLVTIPPSKTQEERSFTISDANYLKTLKKYENLRPSNPGTDRYFLHYDRKTKKCTRQVIGKSTLSGIPKVIARFLKLPDFKGYTGMNVLFKMMKPFYCQTFRTCKNYFCRA